MARYIDVDLLKKRIEYYYSHSGDQTTNAEHYAYGVALKEIDNTPTADVVQVVRCKNCILHEEGCPLDTHPYMTADNGYCYLAKRTPKEKGAIN